MNITPYVPTVATAERLRIGGGARVSTDAAVHTAGTARALEDKRVVVDDAAGILLPALT